MKQKNETQESGAILKVFIVDAEVQFFEFNGNDPVYVTDLPAQGKLGISAFILLCIATAHLSSTQNDQNRGIAWKTIPDALRSTLREAFRKPGKWLIRIFDQPADAVMKYVRCIEKTGSSFNNNICIQIHSNGTKLTDPESIRELKSKIKASIETNLSHHSKRSKSNQMRLFRPCINIHVHRRDNTHFFVDHLASREQLNSKDLVELSIFHPALHFFYVYWIDAFNKTWDLYPDIDKALGVGTGHVENQESGWSLRIPESGMLPEIQSTSGHETCLAIVSNYKVESIDGMSLHNVIHDFVTEYRYCHQRLPTSSFRLYSSDPSTDTKESNVVMSENFGRPSSLTIWEEKLFIAFSQAMSSKNIAFDMCFQNIPVGEP